MCVRLFFALVLLVIVSCGRGQGTDFQDLPCLHAVPSDAVALACYRNCDSCLARMVDSTDALRSVDFGDLRKRPAVFSYNYGAGLVSMLAIDAGNKLQDTSLVIRRITNSLPNIGLHSRFFTIGDSHILAVSRSEELLSAVGFHVASGESILSSDGFRDVFYGNDAIYVRNSTVAPLVRACFPNEAALRKRLTRYLKDACEWVALKDESGGCYSLVFDCDDDARYFANVLKGQGGGISLFTEPEVAAVSYVDLVFDDWHTYRDAFEKYLDAENELSVLKKQKAWAEEFCPKEVAKLSWDGGEVLLARGKKMSSDTTAVAGNPFPGYIPALFGSAFAITDESAMAYAGGWMIIGCAESIEDYIKLNKPEPLPEKGALAKVRIGSTCKLCWNRQGINLYVY